MNTCKKRKKYKKVVCKICDDAEFKMPITTIEWICPKCGSIYKESIRKSSYY